MRVWLATQAVMASPEALEAGVRLAKALRGSDAPSPNPLCIAKNCLSNATKCLVDKDCRKGMMCTAGCGGVNQTCIFQCTSEYENEVYDDMLRCFFTDHDCMKMPAGEYYDNLAMCRGTDVAPPTTTYRNESLTEDIALDLLRRGVNGSGYWLVAKGLSHAYDCFDCQNLWWTPAEDKSPLRYDAIYKIHKPDGGIRWNSATYDVKHYGEAGRFIFHAADYGGLEHEEDWRILAMDERTHRDPQWIALYYCGGAEGVKENYEGSCVVTVDGLMPTDETEVAKINAAYKKAGIDLACTPDNSPEACANHPVPPFAAAEVVV